MLYLGECLGSIRRIDLPRDKRDQATGTSLLPAVDRF